MSPVFRDATALAAHIAGLCANASQTGAGWMASCPAHDDSNPSLSITPDEAQEQVLVHCFAGCATDQVLACLMLEMADVFVGSRARKPKRSGRRVVIAYYDYIDLAGAIRHQKMRYNDPERKYSQRRPKPGIHAPDRHTRDDWIDGKGALQGIETILYHLPQVHAAIQRDELVYLVEGEKDADNVTALGLTATTNTEGGSKGKVTRKWKPSYTETLRGARVVILPDYDETGGEFGPTVARALYGTAAEVTIVKGIHTDAPKSDVSDWLAAGHTRAELEALVAATPLYTPLVSPLPDDAPAQPPAGTSLSLLEKKDGSPRAALGNVLAVLTKDPRWQGVLGYNALSDEVVFLAQPPCYGEVETWKPRPLEDHDDAEIANWLQWHYDVFSATTVVHEAVQAAAHRTPFHPIRDYLAKLTWDQRPRLDMWLTHYCAVEDTLYTRAVARTTLIGAVARVEEPGCKMDTMPLLIGLQGTLKSTTWRVLCSDAWFSDTMPDLHDKDAMQALRGKWIIEFGELATLHRSEIEVVKRYLSATQDHYRPSYGRRARTFLRQNIFVGTSNRADVLKDDTGNRRFYPITTTGICDTETLRADRDQLWAEALHRYQQGEAWHLDPAMTALAEQVQAEHMEVDPWEEPVLTYVEPFEGTIKITTTEVMQEGFHWENPALWTPAASKRIGAILRNDGWRPVKRYAHEATPTQAASKPDPTAPRRRVAAFEKAASPQPDTDDTDDGEGNAPSVSPGYPHEIRRDTDDTDDTDTSTHVRETTNMTQKPGVGTHIPPQGFSSIGEPSVQAVSSVPDRMNTSGHGLWPICVICVIAHNPADICVTADPTLPAVGDLVIPLTADGCQIPDNGVPFPYLVIGIEFGPDGQRYARFMECATGWPLTQCRTVSPSPATEDNA